MKLGLVLAGGGGKGAYQIGVWKALREFGIDKYIQAVSGTSVGALNAILFLQQDIKAAERLWLAISKEKILPTGNFDLVKRGIFLTLGSKNIDFVRKYIPKTLEQGNISRLGLIEIMDNFIDFSIITKSLKSCYATCSEIPSLKPKYFKLNNYNQQEIRDILLATSAIPMIYESEEIETRKYLDGAMADNVPIQPLYGEGCDIIIVVHLSKDSAIDRSSFPNAKLIELIPSEMDQGGLSAVLDFSPEGAKRRIKQGYDDAKNLFEPIIELARYQVVKTPQELVISTGKNMVKASSKIKNIIVNAYRKKLKRKMKRV
ncbi:hypothetical protein CPJCM30710_33300 [Clostridium polyendosporum]|uniref:PNPLA domain-containing protein n=1 Tax=Clostridium polyendosporum TaxID=69208 RepID=A0A919S391_9CLOT|nr:patatin-like phospholipase family protein [Clostridium polyendosporum]GIM30664.1 hypothetical protein CPJCM30710_33300 [Clostridium polyendosporum]